MFEFEEIPIVLDSPVEFFLIGVNGKSRTVIAKSQGARIDLIANTDLENRNTHYYSDTLSNIFLLNNDLELYPFSSESDPISLSYNYGEDERDSRLTFVWRGIANINQLSNVREVFDKNSQSIVGALEQHSQSKLEWALAPLIDKSYRAILHRRKRRSKMKLLFWLTFFTYAVGIYIYFNIRF